MAHDDPTGTLLEDVLELDEAAAVLDTTALDEATAVGMPDDPTGLAGQTADLSPRLDKAIPLTPTPLPRPPIALATRLMSGRYRGQTGAFQVELRVDLDRTRPLNKISADFFSISGGTTTYFGSLIVDSPTITRTATQTVARGTARFTFAAGAPVVQVTIPKRTILQPAAPATLQFFTTGGAPGATYVCGFEAAGFRRVSIETDRVSDVLTPVFATYNSGALPSGGPARAISVVSAFAEAGIELVPTLGSNVVDAAETLADHLWSDAELHASMIRHFSMYRGDPQWSVWQLVCQKHELGPGLYGIMFDQLGAQRQGCAVFHQGIGGTTADKLRLQLYTYVHELGHCFNLLHSWQKAYASPPGVNRPTSLSWMNYPWNYPGGAAAFWNGFNFQFDDPELVHLRHGFRNDVIMGGQPFASHAALIDPHSLADPVRDESGLRLEIEAHHAEYALGEPVVLQLALSLTDRRGKVVHPHLHPKASMVTIAICKPNGDVVRYEPYIDHLMDSTPRFLVDGEKIEDSAYIGYGAGGLYFDRPGTYQVRAIYHAPDGSQVFSNIAKLRVKHPVTAMEEELADLLIGDEQGALFYLLGSDSEALASGNRAFDTILERHAKAPVADYVQAARGVNQARAFVTVNPDATTGFEQRGADLGEATSLLNAATAKDSRVDDLSKAVFLRKLAKAQKREGDDDGCAASLNKAEALRPRRL